MLNVANGPSQISKFPTFANENEEIQHEVMLAAHYDNAHKGIIDTEFIQWAVDDSVSYRVVYWFIGDFSGVVDENILFFWRVFSITTLCITMKVTTV